MYRVLYRWIAFSIRYQSLVLIFTKNGDLITPNHFHGLEHPRKICTYELLADEDHYA